MAGEEKYVSAVLCDARHSEIMRGIEEIKLSQRSLKKSIYEDNGRKSIQTVLRSHDTVIKVVIWLVGAIAVASIAAFAKLIILGGDKIIIEAVK